MHVAKINNYDKQIDCICMNPIVSILNCFNHNHAIVTKLQSNFVILSAIVCMCFVDIYKKMILGLNSR